MRRSGGLDGYVEGRTIQLKTGRILIISIIHTHRNVSMLYLSSGDKLLFAETDRYRLLVVRMYPTQFSLQTWLLLWGFVFWLSVQFRGRRQTSTLESIGMRETRILFMCVALAHAVSIVVSAPYAMVYADAQCRTPEFMAQGNATCSEFNLDVCESWSTINGKFICLSNDEEIQARFPEGTPLVKAGVYTKNLACT